MSYVHYVQSYSDSGPQENVLYMSSCSLAQETLVSSKSCNIQWIQQVYVQSSGCPKVNDGSLVLDWNLPNSENDIVNSSLDEDCKAIWIPVEDAWPEVSTIWEVNK